MAYIDTELLKENFAKRLNKHLGIMIGIDDVAIDLGLAIDDTPTADVVEVKHGEWIDTGDDILDTTYSGWKCSECGYIFCGSKFKFCPDCGAKMDISKMEITTEGSKEVQSDGGIQ